MSKKSPQRSVVLALVTVGCMLLQSPAAPPDAEQGSRDRVKGESNPDQTERRKAPHKVFAPWAQLRTAAETSDSSGKPASSGQSPQRRQIVLGDRITPELIESVRQAQARAMEQQRAASQPLQRIVINGAGEVIYDSTAADDPNRSAFGGTPCFGDDCGICATCAEVYHAEGGNRFLDPLFGFPINLLYADDNTTFTSNGGNLEYLQVRTGRSGGDAADPPYDVEISVWDDCPFAGGAVMLDSWMTTVPNGLPTEIGVNLEAENAQTPLPIPQTVWTGVKVTSGNGGPGVNDTVTIGTSSNSYANESGPICTATLNNGFILANFGLELHIDGEVELVKLQQNLSNIVGDSTVGCPAMGSTTAWARCYHLVNEGVPPDGPITLTSLTIGVQTADLMPGVERFVNIWKDSDGCPPQEPGVDASILCTYPIILPDQPNDADGTLVTIDLTQDAMGNPLWLDLDPSLPGQADLSIIVEIVQQNCDLDSDGDGFCDNPWFAGSNDGGETSPSYLRSPQCATGCVAPLSGNCWNAHEDVGAGFTVHLIQSLVGEIGEPPFQVHCDPISACCGPDGLTCTDAFSGQCPPGSTEYQGATCNSFCCPADPPQNDTCSSATECITGVDCQVGEECLAGLCIHNVPSGVLSGSTQGATGECPFLGGADPSDPLVPGDPIVWEAFELTEPCSEVEISFCGSDPSLPAVWVVVADSCEGPMGEPCNNGEFINLAQTPGGSADFTTCTDTNPTVRGTLPAGTYYYPINGDTCSEYQIQISATPCISCESHLECEDGDDCTTDVCIASSCTFPARLFGDANNDGVGNIADVVCAARVTFQDATDCDGYAPALDEIDIAPIAACGDDELNITDVVAHALAAFQDAVDECCE